MPKSVEELRKFCVTIAAGLVTKGLPNPRADDVVNYAKKLEEYISDAIEITTGEK